METKKQIGIWMDHSKAQVILPELNAGNENTINSQFTQEVKADSMGRSEHVMHNKEQHQRAHFYKSISEAIKGYQEVLLFGPTTAKEELHNLLKEDQAFSKVKIDVKQSDSMTGNQQQAFVKKHFQII